MTHVSVFDLFKVGIGPSSSHTVGPMRAARAFSLGLAAPPDPLSRTTRVQVDLYGSLALTGRGHATDRAVLLGLCGHDPETVDPTFLTSGVAAIRASQSLDLLGRRTVSFIEQRDLLFHDDETLPRHPNAVRFTAFDAQGNVLHHETFYSTGGGFIVRDSDVPGAEPATAGPSVPFPFASATELLAIARRERTSLADVMRANELCQRTDAEIDAGLDRIWTVMRESIDRGCATEGVLPGGLNVQRRAGAMHRRLTETAPTSGHDSLAALDWLSLFALAVNEENAAGGRVVTAPTNGAAGVIPAVIAYYLRFWPGASPTGVRTFLLTAAAVGSLYKRNASLSAAELGCQGEVGVACSMAAAGLAAVMGGSISQVENAAEIGMEHNLGLTCDPIRGLVQIPCIERNTMGAAKALNAARLAVLYGDGQHRVSLDRVIETMRQTGVDMQSKYKETSRGGLAVNVVDC